MRVKRELWRTTMARLAASVRSAREKNSYQERKDEIKREREGAGVNMREKTRE